jgi:hypothetical protein
MSAIITSQFRLETTKQIIKNHQNQDGDEYYLFIGKSDPWTEAGGDTTTDVETLYDNHFATRHSVWHNILAMKKLEPSTSVTASSHSVAFATPRKNLYSGRNYSEYDGRDEQLEFKADNPYYAMDDSYTVWMCLVPGASESTQAPGNVTSSHWGDSTIKECTDGYIWKRLYTIPQKYYKYVSSAFIPVPDIDSLEGLTTTETKNNREAWTMTGGNIYPDSIDGAIYNVKVAVGGGSSNLSGTITAKVVGNGSGCTLDVVTVGTATGDGVITGFTVTSPGSGYTEAHVEVYDDGTLVTDAVGQVVLGPKGGFGYNPANELRAHFVSVSTQLMMSEGDAFIAEDGSFRQIGLIKNPTDSAGVLLEGPSYALTKTLKFQVDDVSHVDSWLTGNFFRLAPSTWTGDIVYGIIDDKITISETDSVSGTTTHTAYIKYHQNDLTGFSPILHGSEHPYGTSVRLSGINQSYGSTPVGTTPFIAPPTTYEGDEKANHLYDDVKRYSGDIIFLDNRTPVNRSETQTETINLVLEI